MFKLVTPTQLSLGVLFFWPLTWLTALTESICLSAVNRRTLDVCVGVRQLWGNPPESFHFPQPCLRSVWRTPGTRSNGVTNMNLLLKPLHPSCPLLTNTHHHTSSGYRGWEDRLQKRSRILDNTNLFCGNTLWLKIGQMPFKLSHTKYTQSKSNSEIDNCICECYWLSPILDSIYDIWSLRFYP